MTGPTDLSALNPIERRFLLLLAQGHTAKSIAARENCSVGAVNERLREARRKTGYGSSREVARAVLAQENRDEQIGMASASDAASSSKRQADWPAHRRWIMPMLAAGGVAALASALTLAIPSDAPPKPTASGLPKPLFQNLTAQFAKHLDAEPRDAFWAVPTEAALRNRFAAFPVLTDLRVRCGTSLCEVTGIFAATAVTGRARDTQRDLQAQPLMDDLSRIGLKHELGSFFLPRKPPRQLQYASYWSRVPGK